MKNPIFATIAAIVFGVLTGCQDGETDVVKTDSTRATQVEGESQVESEKVRPEDFNEPKDPADFRKRTTDLLKQATDSSSDGADTARKWITDRMYDATDSGTAIAGDASEWASEMFQSLKDQGLTSADNARQWLTDDIRNMNALNYKIVRVSLDDLEAVEAKLNELGALRWECFHAVDQDGETVLFFKKNSRSILRNIPATDLMKLIPLMGSSDKE